MTPFLSLLLPIVVSAVAVFILSLIIHMTRWHKGDYVRLPDEDGVMRALRPFKLLYALATGLILAMMWPKS